MARFASAERMDSPFVFARDIPAMPSPSYGDRYIFTCDFLLGIYCDVQRNTSYIHHLLRIHHIRVGRVMDIPRNLRLTDNQQAIRTTTIPACPLWPLLPRGTVLSMDGFFRYATDFPNTHLIAGNSPWLSSATCRIRNPDPGFQEGERAISLAILPPHQIAF